VQPCLDVVDYLPTSEVFSASDSGISPLDFHLKTPPRRPDDSSTFEGIRTKIIQKKAVGVIVFFT